MRTVLALLKQRLPGRPRLNLGAARDEHRDAWDAHQLFQLRVVDGLGLLRRESGDELSETERRALANESLRDLLLLHALVVRDQLPAKVCGVGSLVHSIGENLDVGRIVGGLVERVPKCGQRRLLRIAKGGRG